MKRLFGSHYRKMLLLYSSFTIAVIMVSSLLIIHYFNNSLSREASLSNNRLLTQIQISSDAILYEIQSFVNEGFLDMYRENSLYGFFRETRELGPDQILHARNRISAFAVDHRYIDSIYLYHKAFDTFLSSREGVVFSASQSDNYNRKYIHFDAVSRLMDSPQSHFWISSAENRPFWSARPVLSFAHAIPLFAAPEHRRGGIVVNIDEERFLQAINVLAGSDYSLLIVDAAGNLVSHSENARGYVTGTETEGTPPFLRHVLEAPEGDASYRLRGQTFGVSWVDSSVNGWKYVSLAPVQTINAESFIARQFAVLCILLIILFSLVGLKMLTTRMYKPMAHMEETIAKNQSLIRHKAIGDIIAGHVSPADNMNDLFRLVGGTPRHRFYCVVIAEVQFLKKPSFEEREFVLYELIHTVEQLLEGPFSCFSITSNPNHVVTIVNLEEEAQLSGELERLLEACNQDSGFRCNLAVSGATDLVPHIHSLYAQAQSFLKYSFICGYGQLFTGERIERHETNGSYIDARHLKQARALLASGKGAPLKEHLSELFRLLKAEPFSYNYVQNLLMQLLTLYIDAFEERRIADGDIDRNRLLIRFHQLASLEQCLDWFAELTDAYAGYAQTQLEAIDQQFIARIRAYVEAHIDKDISLNHVAEQFGISASYLSKIFKDSTDVNFSKYTIDLKLKRAAEMFLEARGRKVSEVANALGYYNLPYFIAIFKEKYGVTPAKYRKIHSDS